MRTVPGLHIQAPWAEWIVSGKKTIETRRYPLPMKYLGQDMAIIETPGKLKPRFKARIIGLVRFMKSAPYASQRAWLADGERHLVPSDHPDFGYKKGEPKFAWVVGHVERISPPINPPRARGIVFVRACKIL